MYYIRVLIYLISFILFYLNSSLNTYGRDFYFLNQITLRPHNLNSLQEMGCLNSNLFIPCLFPNKKIDKKNGNESRTVFNHRPSERINILNHDIFKPPVFLRNPTNEVSFQNNHSDTTAENGAQSNTDSTQETVNIRRNRFQITPVEDPNIPESNSEPTEIDSLDSIDFLSSEHSLSEDISSINEILSNIARGIEQLSSIEKKYRDQLSRENLTVVSSSEQSVEPNISLNSIEEALVALSEQEDDQINTNEGVSLLINSIEELINYIETDPLISIHSVDFSLLNSAFRLFKQSPIYKSNIDRLKRHLNQTLIRLQMSQRRNHVSTLDKYQSIIKRLISLIDKISNNHLPEVHLIQILKQPHLYKNSDMAIIMEIINFFMPANFNENDQMILQYATDFYHSIPNINNKNRLKKIVNQTIAELKEQLKNKEYDSTNKLNNIENTLKVWHFIKEYLNEFINIHALTSSILKIIDQYQDQTQPHYKHGLLSIDYSKNVKQNIEQKLHRLKKNQYNIIDPTDESTFDILLNGLIELFFQNFPEIIKNPQLEKEKKLLLLALHHFKLDPYSRDNAIILASSVDMLINSMALIEQTGFTEKFILYKKTFYLLLEILEQSFLKRDEMAIKLRLKDNLKGFETPGEESLYRIDATIRLGGGAFGGMFSTQINNSFQDWTVTTDTAKVLHQIKKGTAIAADFSIQMFLRRLKASVSTVAMIGTAEARLYNSVNDYIEDQWHKKAIEANQKKLWKVIKRLFTNENKNQEKTQKTLSLNIEKLKQLLQQVGLIDPTNILIYQPKESLVSAIDIFREVLEMQQGVRAGIGITKDISTSLSLDFFYLYWKNTYQRLTPLSNYFMDDQHNKDFNYLTLDYTVFNIELDQEVIPSSIIKFMNAHYAEDLLEELTHSQAINDTRQPVFIGKLLNRMKLINITQLCKKEVCTKINKKELADFYLTLIKYNFSNYIDIRLALLQGDKHIIQKHLQARHAESLGQLQLYILATFIFLHKNYLALQTDNDTDLSHYFKTILTYLSSNTLHLSKSDYQKYMMLNDSKKGETKWKTIVFRKQFLIGEILGNIRWISDIGHCNPDSNGDFLLVTFRTTGTLHLNFSENINSSGFFNYIKDILTRHVDGDVDIIIDPGIEGLTLQTGSHLKHEFFFVKAKRFNGKTPWVLQYRRSYIGHESAFRVGKSLYSCEGSVLFGAKLVSDVLKYHAINESWGVNTLTYLTELFHGLKMAGRENDIDTLLSNKKNQQVMAKMIINMMNPENNIHDEFVERLSLIDNNIDWKIYIQQLNANDITLEINPSDKQYSIKSILIVFKMFIEQVKVHTPEKYKEKYYKRILLNDDIILDNMSRHESFHEAITAMRQFLAMDYTYYLTLLDDGFVIEKKFQPCQFN